MSGVEEVTSEAGLDLLLTVVGEDGGRQHAPIEQRLRQRADGAIVVALPTDNPDVRQILDAGIPASMVGSMVSGVPGVAIDDVDTARTATRHLLNLGHRSIGLISGDPGGSQFTVQHQRQLGYAETLTAAGIAYEPALTAFGEFTQDGGERAMVRLLSGATMPTAVVCMSDEMAFGALIALRRHGLVPGVDISVIGIDGHPQAEVVDLTTVEQPVAHMGRLAAEALMAHLAGSDESSAVSPGIVPTELVVRGSTAAPRTT
jgi:DNA-binding LacI/PurR family transcriptional regulator